MRGKKVVVHPQALRPKTEIVLILDESGSMDPVRDVTIQGFNEQIQRIANYTKDQDIKVSLIVFNDPLNIREVFWRAHPNEVKEIDKKDYRPNGSTALNDAVGSTINRLALEEDKEASYLVIIMTDGEENASRVISRQQVASRIKELQETKRWTFSYIGANMDMSQVAKAYNIPVGNTQAYVGNIQGTIAAASLTSGATANYLHQRTLGNQAVTSFYVDPDKSVTTASSLAGKKLKIEQSGKS